jgi:hypothetical protein
MFLNRKIKSNENEKEVPFVGPCQCGPLTECFQREDTWASAKLGQK